MGNVKCFIVVIHVIFDISICSSWFDRPFGDYIVEVYLCFISYTQSFSHLFWKDYHYAWLQLPISKNGKCQIAVFTQMFHCCSLLLSLTFQCLLFTNIIKVIIDFYKS